MNYLTPDDLRQMDGQTVTIRYYIVQIGKRPRIVSEQAVVDAKRGCLTSDIHRTVSFESVGVTVEAYPYPLKVKPVIKDFLRVSYVSFILWRLKHIKKQMDCLTGKQDRLLSKANYLLDKGARYSAEGGKKT